MAIGLTPGMMFRGFGDPRGTPPYAPVDVPQAPEMTPGVGMSAVPAAKPGFFGEGGLGRSIAGSIGDFLLQNSGMRPVFAPAMQERRQRQQQVADRQAAKLDAYEIWKAQQAYKIAHPDTPDIVERMRALDTVEPGLGATYARNYANNGGGVPQITTIPGIGTVAIPRGPVSPTPAGPQPGTVEGGYRFKGGNAADPSAWEPVGGAPSQGGATFR